MKRKQWYEKYIGYCFNDNGREVILDDVFEYEDGRKCFEWHYTDDGSSFICDWKVAREIKNQTNLPK